MYSAKPLIPQGLSSPIISSSGSTQTPISSLSSVPSSAKPCAVEPTVPRRIVAFLTQLLITAAPALGRCAPLPRRTPQARRSQSASPSRDVADSSWLGDRLAVEQALDNALPAALN